MDGARLRAELERLHAAGYAWALGLCGYRDDEARDVLQATYIKVLEGRARYGGASSLKTWLFAVIRKTAADHRRRAAVRRLALGRHLAREAPLVSPASSAEIRADAARACDRERERIVAALATLSRRQREVIELVFYHDLTVREAAGIMGVSVGSARRHYDRGKRALAAKLADELAPEVSHG